MSIVATSTSRWFDLVTRREVHTVDKSRQQIEAINRGQQLAETVKGGQTAESATAIRSLHQNAHALIRTSGNVSSGSAFVCGAPIVAPRLYPEGIPSH